jgi:T5SS/PEP-CTERM-associated repeat protein
VLVWWCAAKTVLADAFQWLDGTPGGFADHNKWKDVQNQTFDPPDPNPFNRYPGPNDIVSFPQDLGAYSVTIFDASVRGTSIADTFAGSLITLFINGTYRAGETYVINTLFSGAGTLVAEPVLLYDTVLSGVQANFTRLTVDSSKPPPVHTGMVVRNEAHVTSRGPLVLDAGVTLDNGTWTHTGILPGAAVDVLNGGRLIVREINAADPPSEANLLVSSGGMVDMDHIQGRVDATTAGSVTVKRAELFSSPAFLNPAVFRDGGTMLTVLDRLHVAGGPLQFRSGGRLHTLNLSHEQGAFSTEAIDSGSAIDVTGLLDSGLVAAKAGASASVATASNANLTADGAGSRVTFDSLTSAAPQSASFVATAGGVLSGRDVILGSGSGTVSGAGSRLELTEELIMGQGNLALLTLNSGGRIDSRSLFLGTAGGGTAGEGRATVSGADSLMLVRVGVLTGADPGAKGTLTAENSARIQAGLPDPSAIGIGMAFAAGSEGQLIVRSGAVVDSRSPTGPGLTSGIRGTGTISVNSAGRVLTNRLSAGDYPGSDGIVTCSGPGSSIEVDLELLIGDEGRGRLNVLNQSIVTADEIRAGNAMLANEINVRLGGTLRYDKALYVGHDGSATMRITQGGIVHSNNPKARLGLGENGTASSGTLLIDGAGSSISLPHGGMLVGSLGTGFLTVSSGGVLAIEVAAISTFDGSGGAATVTGAGSLWTLSDKLHVGGFYAGVPGSLTVADSGLVRAGKVMTITPKGLVTLNGGSIAVGAGDPPQGTLRVGPGGVLNYAGRVVGGKVIQGIGGVIKPGQSPGLARIEGDFEQEAGAETEMEIAGLTPGALHDRLEVTGAVQLNGKLSVAFINGFAPRAGQTFELLAAGSLTGNFTEVLVTGLQPGFQHELTIANNRVQFAALNDGVATTSPAEPVITIETFGHLTYLSRPALLEGWSWQTSADATSGSWTTLPNAGNVIPLISNRHEGRRFYRLARP